MKLSPKQREALQLIADGKFYPDFVKEEDGWHARWRAIQVDNFWVDEYVREAAMTPLSEKAENERYDTLHDAWMMALKSHTGLVKWNEKECSDFAARLKDWHGGIEDTAFSRHAIEFRFEPPYLKVAIPKTRAALKALGESIHVFSPTIGLKKTDENTLSVKFSHAECESFLRRGARDLRDAGYSVVGADIETKITADVDLIPGDKKDSILAKLVIKVSGEPVNAEEIRFLLAQGTEMVFFKERWIKINREYLRQALRLLEKNEKPVASPLAFALGLGYIGGVEIAKVKAHGWLKGLVNELKAAKKLAEALKKAEFQAEGLVGELRDYQERGVKWIRFLTENGFGALLADDMGLGKTIQTIAWLLSKKESPPSLNTKHLSLNTNKGHALIVAPLTLLSNWAHEIKRFAPSLKVYVHHGENRQLGIYFKRYCREADVVLTSYNLLVKDYVPISRIEWDTLVLDEAQAIKNSDTAVAKAVKALRPRNRLALTGTPIENSLSDIWSIEDFLNPGFLGFEKDFNDRIIKPIKAHENAVELKRLKSALEPFVLRRLKSEKSIAAELGTKREIKEYCPLSVDERREYEAMLEDFRLKERKRGDIFALINSLKLICDGDGKRARLFDLLEAIFAAGESALVFTQYAKVGAELQAEMEKRFSRRFPFLHGGLGVKAREREIADFNREGPSAFILSLKAGGFGLNLTKATHVIHFDRWWNPAVENQATDRAYRIGQVKDVFVHVFITAGTIEEHVDDLLERKERLAGGVISEAEWLEAIKLDEP
ncbi:MAG: DEAD/DEAH box helicase [Kiritimatiellae bacterium]|nr:DEAD/DEAH box helicase [Kiritimatiellia bacterium]